MSEPIAIVGVGAILPDAPDVTTFWHNVEEGRYSISDVQPDRWDPELYFDPDPKAKEKTYTKLGGWVRQWEWAPLEWRLPIPPTVAEAMDDAQKWAVACTRAALVDYGWPGRAIDGERTAVILGNAMAGEKHYQSSLRIAFPDVLRRLGSSSAFSALPADVRLAIEVEFRQHFEGLGHDITEDTMPGELGNCIAGRVANVFDLRGPNFVVDAACASALAAFDASIAGLASREFDLAISGGVDRNMGAATYVKFCKIGALSATGTRPFDEGADGFVMGEGAALFVLKRLADAERDGDRIYAVVLGVGGSSDGRGKGITAPNPVGQRLAIARAWADAGLSPEACSFVEAHGTSTRVGDVVEVTSLSEVFASANLAPGSVALGSVKSNLGHLKAAAGAAGLLKTVLALNAKRIPPSLGFRNPNPNIDWSRSPFYVNTELADWKVPAGKQRCAGVSAFGFGGTNFHAVLAEYVPALHASEGRNRPSGEERSRRATEPTISSPATPKDPPRGATLLGAASEDELSARLRSLRDCALAGDAPQPKAPAAAALDAPERVALDYGDATELAERSAAALEAVTRGPAAWKLLQGRGVFRGRGAPGKVAFLFTGQGSQYPNMLAKLRDTEPVVAATFAEADTVMAPLIGRPLSEVIFVDPASEEQMAASAAALRRTEITQPAVLAADIALTRLLAAYGIVPDVVMGHSLGEYGALVAAGSLSFANALEAVSARGREMASLLIEDAGLMVAVSGPLETVEEIVAGVDGNVVVANVNSTTQCVIGGATPAVQEAEKVCRDRGLSTARLPVSHAFHTSIVAPASEPLRKTLERLDLRPPVVPIISNVTGDFYPSGPDVVPEMLDLLARQVASPVQFVKGLRRLADAGATVFVEVGPKWALRGFASEVLGGERGGASMSFLASNHPKVGDIVSFNHALCGLYAAGIGEGRGNGSEKVRVEAVASPTVAASAGAHVGADEDVYVELGHLFADFLERGRAIYDSGAARPGAASQPGASRPREDLEPVVITGAAIGTPGTPHVFDDLNIGRLLNGTQFIDVIPTRIRNEMLEHNITRLVKSEDGASFETIDNPKDVIKLAARAGEFDLSAEFGLDADRVAAYGRTTRLAMAAGLDALRDAGIPMMMRYKTTHLGTKLPERWGLPDALRDDTGVIFASAFPGLEEFAAESSAFATDRTRQEEMSELEAIRSRLEDVAAADVARDEIDRRLHDLRKLTEDEPYHFDRRFLFHVLSMGHSQFADVIGARGPNTQINAACASTAQAVAIAHDWIRAGRCRRVVVVAGDDVTSDRLLGWFGSGFLAAGAAATDEDVTAAALPFDRRRHGMVLGMGAAAIVVEEAKSARERGLRPICEVLGAETANSAFHGTRLDVDHIGDVMERLVAGVETRTGLDRRAIAPETVFVSHETYTPARGGSASAEIFALRRVFGEDADKIVIANTKGFTGHPMAVGLEDVVAVKTLETGIVPPVANYREPDPELGQLNLSKGGAYPVEYALRLAAGFGSQIAMLLLKHTPPLGGHRPAVDELGFGRRIFDQAQFDAWLALVSGRPEPRLEVAHRQLRLVDDGPPEMVGVTPAAVEPAPVVEAPTPLTAEEPPLCRPVPVAPASPFAAETEAVAVASGGAKAAGDPVVDRIVSLVSEQTGYPADMLALDLDLEADLGIDTVKQAEFFARIREEYGIERDENLRLRDYPTLSHVVGFVRERSSVLPAAGVAPVPPEPSARPAMETVTSSDTATVSVAGERPGAPGSGTPGGDPVVDRIVALVSEQTGYPADMLALDLDLEADLGIDTVKQAEFFARIREEYGIERDENLRLRDYPTLSHVVGFVHERAATLEEPAETESPAVGTEAAAALEGTGPTGAEDNRFLRRVPLPILLPPLEACRPTGISLAGARVVVVADSSGVAPLVVETLEKEGAETLVIDGLPSEASVLKSLNTWRKKGHVTGVFWLPAIDDEGALDDMDADVWREGLRVRVKLLAATMRELYGEVSGPGTFLLSATRLGGQHGYGSGGATAPMGGAVTGFTKAYAREQPEVLVKAVDFATTEDAAEISERLLAEALRDPSTVEVGYAGGRRWSVALAEQSAVDGGPEHALTADSVLVVSGAAGSIVSAVICDLARCKGTFHLLDRVPEPDATDPDLERFVADRTGLKRDIAVRIEMAGERATPAKVDRRLAELERERAALDAMAAVRAAGGTVLWHQVDLTDHTAVAQVMKTIANAHPRVDVLLHCAGVEKSRMLDSKPPEEFDLVFDVKSDGWFNLLQGLGAHPLGTAAVFSSIAGRFGNGGQTDYSAANDLCCKVVSSLRSTRPETRGVAIDWTAWASIGMASRGSIPKIMELAGIEMLPPEVAIPIVRREITAGGPGGEVVAAGRLGTMAPEANGSDSIEPAPTSPVLTRSAGPMLGQVVAWDSSRGLTFETELDPTKQLFLDHHRIDGTAVLPGVMGVEAFAEAASASAPGWTVAAVEDVEFRAPFKFFRDEPRTFALSARPLLDGAGLKVDCRLVASRSLADGSEQFTTHFTGRVELVEGALPTAATEPPVLPAGPRVDPAAIYAIYFHGPAYRVLDLAGRVGNRMIGRFAEGLPLSHGPATANLVLEPRLLELCFQTAGILELGETGRLALPQKVGRVQLFTVKKKVGRWYAAVTPRVDGRGVDAVVADETGHVCMSVEAYVTIPLPGGVTNDLLEPLRLACQ